MTGTKAKGKRMERLVRDYLRSRGHEAWSVPWAKWGEEDIFGLFDVIALNERHAVVFISVTDKTHRAARRRAITPWACEHTPNAVVRVMSYGDDDFVEDRWIDSFSLWSEGERIKIDGMRAEIEKAERVTKRRDITLERASAPSEPPAGRKGEGLAFPSDKALRSASPRTPRSQRRSADSRPLPEVKK